MGKKKSDPYADFKALSKDGQRQNILSTTGMCIDAAPVSLARKIEIHLADDPCPYDCGYCHPDDDV